MDIETELQTEQTIPAPSIRDELTAAMGTDAPASEAAPAPATPAPKPEGNALARAPDGKFAKAPEAAPNTPEPNAQAAPGPDASQTIRPPASWSATAKADFATLPPHIQQEVLKREGEIEAGKAQWDQKANRFNRLDAVLSPREEAFRLRGIDEVQAVQSLLAAQDFLERDAPSALQYLARQYGVNLASLAPGAPQPQQAQLPPAIQQMAQELNTLKQTLAQQSTAAHQQAVSETQAQIDAFSADPANLYFPNVKVTMGKLIAAGEAMGLKDAYDKAVWAHPEIRPLLLRDQQAQGQATQEQQDKARAEAARRASGSIVGSPTPGSSPSGPGPASSIRAELQRAMSGV